MEVDIMTRECCNSDMLTCGGGGGGGGTPGGADKQIQFNDAGSFGGTSLVYWDKILEYLGIGTATPSARFHVVGDMKLYGNIKTDKTLEDDTNTFFGVDSCPAGLIHTGGDEGWWNSSFGYNSLKTLTTGYGNMAMGSNVMPLATTAWHNVGMGASLYQLIDGYENVAVGIWAYTWSQHGFQNTAIGTRSLMYNLGDRNIGIGYNAFSNYVNSSDNIIIGNNCVPDSLSSGYRLNIGDLLKGRIYGAYDRHLFIDGGLRQKRQTVTANYTMGINDYAITVDASSNTVDVTLPSSPPDGHIVEIKARNLTNTARIIGTIDGATNYTFTTQYANIRLMYNADASEWEVR
jgi:hypothetical protein